MIVLAKIVDISHQKRDCRYIIGRAHSDYYNLMFLDNE